MSGRALRTHANSAQESLQTAANSLELVFTAAVIRALGTLRLSEKELAAAMKLTASQWSQQKALATNHHISVQRLDVLPESLRRRFMMALLHELADELGVAIAVPNGHLKHLADVFDSMAAAVRAAAVNQPVASGPPLPLLEDRPRV